MSLIDDALKRAREEATRQEAAKRSGPSRWAPSHIPGARGSPWKGATALAAVFLAGCGAAWLLLAPRPPRTSPAPIEARPAPAPDPARNPAPKLAPARIAPEKIDEAPAPGLRPRASSERSSGLSTTSSPPGAASVGAPAAPASATRADEKTVTSSRKAFVRTATLPGGETIELGGIVYSEENPIALINGKVVAPGGSVGDFTVVEIRPERVDFEGNGATFSIFLR